MNTVKLSAKYQVVIPQSVRESLQLRPGEKFQVFQYGDHIEVIPVKALKSMRGFLKGIDTNVPRTYVPDFRKTRDVKFKRKR